MDRLFTPLAIGLFVLLGVAVLVAWWEHRKRELEIRRRLERAERTRQALRWEETSDPTTGTAAGAAETPPASAADRPKDAGATPPPSATATKLTLPGRAETASASAATSQTDALHFADTLPAEVAFGEARGEPPQPS